MKDINNIISLFQEKKGPLKTAEILEAGILYSQILSLEEKGEIIRIKNGYYVPREVTLSEEELVVSLFQDAVFTMETALFYHGYLRMRPKKWKIAVSKNISKSRVKLQTPEIEPYYTQEDLLQWGVEKKELSSGSIQLYSVDRLICEILKYENRVNSSDLKVALKHYIRDKNKNVNNLILYSQKRKVKHKVEHMILPWIEMPKTISSKENKKEEDQNSETKTIVPYHEKELAEEDIALILYQYIVEQGTIGWEGLQLYENICTKSFRAYQIIRLIQENIEKKKKDSWRLPPEALNVAIDNLVEYIELNKEKSQIISGYDKKKTKNILEKFTMPLFASLEEKIIYTKDWMPELERYL